jgi:hypothetical protein
VVDPSLSLVRAEEVLRLQALAASYFQALTLADFAAIFAQSPEPLFNGLEGLDLASVVEDLCVKVDILAVEFPTDLQPGVVAPLRVQAGLVFTGGGPPFFSFPLDVDVDAVGASPAVRVGATGGEGRFTTTFTPTTTGVTLNIVATYRPINFPYLRGAALTDTETVGGVGGVIVSPSQTTINPGQSRQFNATVEGTTNQAVTWSVSGGGSITQTGLFTSNGVLGTFFVTATSVADPSQVGIAQVTVAAPSFVGRYDGTVTACLPNTDGTPGCTDVTAPINGPFVIHQLGNELRLLLPGVSCAGVLQFRLVITGTSFVSDLAFCETQPRGTAVQGQLQGDQLTFTVCSSPPEFCHIPGRFGTYNLTRIP